METEIKLLEIVQKLVMERQELRERVIELEKENRELSNSIDEMYR